MYKHACIKAASIDGQFGVNAALWKLSPLFQIRNPEGMFFSHSVIRFSGKMRESGTKTDEWVKRSFRQQ